MEQVGLTKISIQKWALAYDEGKRWGHLTTILAKRLI